MKLAVDTRSARPRRSTRICLAAGGAALCAALLAFGTPRVGAQTLEVIHGFDVPPTNPYGTVIRGFDGAFYGTTVSGGAKGYGVVFKINKDGARLVKLHDFNGADGANPYAGLVEASDGVLYGTTNAGAKGYGVVFKINKDGTGFQKLHDFNNKPDGASPYAGLLEGSDGALYGTTRYGGATGYGIIYKLNKGGTGFQRLHDFNNRPDGASPYAGLVEGSDGALYGTTYGGGAKGDGVVFKVNKDGTGFLKLGDFNDTVNGAHPYAGVVEGSDGALYGTTHEGGVYGAGVVFKVDKDGTGFVKLRDFSGEDSDGDRPYAGLVEGSDGALYGTTLYGGRHSYGMVFKISKDGTGFRRIHSFNYDDGSRPYGGLVEGSDGAFYGTTNLGGDYRDGVAFKLNEDGTGFRDLHVFGGGNGAHPYADLLEGSNGVLYGTTVYGGTHSDGVAFKLNKDGTGGLKLHDFFRVSDGNGGNPYGGLVEASDGVLYGTTEHGGVGGDSSNSGIVFHLGKSGGFYRLRDLDDYGGANGANPHGGLVEGSDGALYGTTVNGGANEAGVVFKLNKDGSEYVQLLDLGGNDGANPYAGLVEDSNGALFGTTVNGGAHDAGVVFKVNRDGTGFLKLHDFNHTDGANPYAGLVEGSDGALYGATANGGANGAGMVFKVGKDGTGFLSLHDFNSIDGANPRARLVERFDGALYGTTEGGGANEAGVVFKLNKDGSGFLNLHDFSTTDGANPYAGLLAGSDGALYGTTVNGGPRGGGVVFRLTLEGEPSWRRGASPAAQ